MYCELCGVEAETQKVKIRRNIGILILRFPGHISGRLCRKCIDTHIIKYTLTSLALGWWGIMSFFWNIFFLLNNFYTYMKTRDLEPVSNYAEYPQLRKDDIEKLKPFSNEIITRIRGKEEIIIISKDIANKTNVGIGNIILFIRTLIGLSKKRR